MTSKKQSKLIFVCSPYRPKKKTGITAYKQLQENIEIANAACREIALAGDIPYAPHLFAPNFLNDKDRKERNIGINIGLDILKRCDRMEVIAYKNQDKTYGLSTGMKKEVKFAKDNNIKIVYKCAKRKGDVIEFSKIKEREVKW